VELVHLVGFVIKKFVMMQHGHMNIKKKFCVSIGMDLGRQ